MLLDIDCHNYLNCGGVFQPGWPINTQNSSKLHELPAYNTTMSIINTWGKRSRLCQMQWMLHQNMLLHDACQSCWWSKWCWLCWMSSKGSLKDVQQAPAK